MVAWNEKVKKGEQITHTDALMKHIEGKSSGEQMNMERDGIWFVEGLRNDGTFYAFPAWHSDVLVCEHVLYIRMMPAAVVASLYARCTQACQNQNRHKIFVSSFFAYLPIVRSSNFGHKICMYNLSIGSIIDASSCLLIVWLLCRSKSAQAWPSRI